MTGGWAATNTLREALRYGRPVGMGSNEQALAALALVEAALDAAEKAEDALRIHGRGVELIGARVDLAAALRAVRAFPDGEATVGQSPSREGAS